MSRRQGVTRYHNGCCTDTLDGLHEHVPQICTFHGPSLLLVKSNASGLRTTLLKCQIIEMYGLSDVTSKEFCCIYIYKFRNHHHHHFKGSKITKFLEKFILFQVIVKWQTHGHQQVFDLVFIPENLNLMLISYQQGHVCFMCSVLHTNHKS